MATNNDTAALEAKIKQLESALAFKDATILNLKTGSKNYSGDLALKRELELKDKIIKGECVDWAEICSLLEKLGIQMQDNGGYTKCVAECIQELYDTMATQLRNMSAAVARCKKDMPVFTSALEFPGPYQLEQVGSIFEVKDKNGTTLLKISNETMAKLAVDCMNIVLAFI